MAGYLKMGLQALALAGAAYALMHMLAVRKIAKASTAARLNDEEVLKVNNEFRKVKIGGVVLLTFGLLSLLIQVG